MITSWFDERVERFATTETESNLKSNVQNKGNESLNIENILLVQFDSIYLQPF